ncbi:MAG: flagellar motor switch protein FliN [Clostridia bacterium]|jgi:flagellar motor switch protein FliN/FliY|nr:flagellar motor switch protein FliN [Clostridia bacterium]
MSEGILSQAEIDALLKDNDFSEENGDELITDIEKDALGEVANISMGTAATTLSTLLGKKVEITTPKVELTSKSQLKEDYPKPYVIIDVKYTSGLQGHNVLIINTTDAAIIADLMMGGTGQNPPEELTELHMSAISEAMNQMMGSASTSMSTVLDKRIDISPPKLDLIDFQEDNIVLDEQGSEPIVKVSFRMVIQGLADSQLMQLIPYNFAKLMLNELFDNYSSNPEQETSKSNYYLDPPPEDYPIFSSEDNSEPKVETKIEQKSVTVQPANFIQLSPQTQQSAPQNLDLILDVPLQVSVELGRTNKTIKEILEFSTGSIIELNKLAGEPVDMLINGKLFAKGEVVVIDENFGVRITDIISPLERVKNLQ